MMSYPRTKKRPKIHPIHEDGDRDCIENYRQILILPSISKILKKHINTQLVNYLESKKKYQVISLAFIVDNQAMSLLAILPILLLRT